MKILININSIGLSILMLIALSCNNEDFFELNRPPEFPWQDVAEYEKAAIGAYNCIVNNSIDNSNAWSNIFGQEFAYDFTISNNARYVVGSIQGFPQDLINGRQFDKTYDQLNITLNICYQAIGECNTGIDFYESNNGNPFPNAKNVDKVNNVNRIVGELYFVRAYTYFYLVRNFHPPYDPNGKNDFKGLAYRSSLPKNMAECLSPEFLTTGEFYDVIVSDLKKAMELLPQKYVAGSMHPAYQYGRANQFVAAAVLARIYLLIGKHTGSSNDNAEYLLDYIVENGGYALEPEIVTNFKRSYNNYSTKNSEILWEFFTANTQNNAGTTPGRLSHFAKSAWGRNDKQRRNPLFADEGIATTGGRGNNWSFGSWPQYSLSHVTLKNRTKWMNQDETLSDIALKDQRYHQVYCYMKEYKQDIDKSKGEDTLYLSQAWAQKETHPTIWIDKAYRGIEYGKTNTPVIRYPEILINRSIIRFRKGDKSGAATDLNIVRKRAWFDSSTAYEQSTEYLTEANITEEIILAEHVKELSGEGLWLNFLISLRLPIPKADTPDAGPQIDPPYSNMYWPIPASETMYYQ